MDIRHSSTCARKVNGNDGSINPDYQLNNCACTCGAESTCGQGYVSLAEQLTKIKSEFPTFSPSAGHDHIDELLGLLRVAYSQRDTAEKMIAQRVSREELDKANARLDWLDQHCAFVADYEYNIGPYKAGQLRQMADDGIAQTARLQKGKTESDQTPIRL